MFRKNSVMTNIFLLLSCIILLGAVGFILIKDKQEAEEVVKEVETVVSKEEETQEEPPQKEKPAVETVTPMPTQTPVAEKEEIKGIVCWGDDLMTADTTDKYSYMAVLQRILQEKGYDIPVINKTIQGGGTLSIGEL